MRIAPMGGSLMVFKFVLVEIFWINNNDMLPSSHQMIRRDELLKVNPDAAFLISVEERSRFLMSVKATRILVPKFALCCHSH
jgi:hypothetical protein